MSKNAETEKSTGNVFRDLGLPDADERLVKADLAIQIAEIIEKRGLTQKEAAGKLAVDQPRVSDLMRGKLKRFSVYRLMTLLSRLGQTIEIAARESASGGGVRVVRPEQVRRATKPRLSSIKVRRADKVAASAPASHGHVKAADLKTPGIELARPTRRIKKKAGKKAGKKPRKRKTTGR